MFLKGSDYSNKTVDNYRFHVNAFVDTCWPELQNCSDIDTLTEAFTKYLDDKAAGVSYKRISVSAFRRLLSMFDYDSRKFKYNLPKTQKKGVYYLTEDQVCGILKEVEDKECSFLAARNSTILAIFSYLGLRLSELADLKVEDVDCANKQIRVLGKGNKEGYVPIIKVVSPHIERWLYVRSQYPSNCDNLITTKDGNKLSKRAIQYICTGYVKRFGDKYSTHSLRHSAATMLINKGVELKTVSTLLRHSSISVTADTYAHKTIESVREDMDSVFGG